MESVVDKKTVLRARPARHVDVAEHTRRVLARMPKVMALLREYENGEVAQG